MRIALLADIHGNLEALNSVLTEIKNLKIKKIWCLGDLVGYGPEPAKVIEWAQKNKIPTVKGNHEAGVLGEINLEWFNPIAKQVILWTQKNLSNLNIKFLKKLPLKLEIQNYVLVHGSLREPLTEYILDKITAEVNLDLLKKDILLVGHSHFPFIFKKNFLPFSYKKEFFLQPNCKYLINPGSIGQPRDRNPQAAWLEIETQKRKIIFHRTSYNIKKTQIKMKKLNFPSFLIERLAWGI